MTPSEAGTEDHDLQEILDRENPDLEKFLEQGKKIGVDSLPKEDYDRVQQLFSRGHKRKERESKEIMKSKSQMG